MFDISGRVSDINSPLTLAFPRSERRHSILPGNGDGQILFETLPVFAVIAKMPTDTSRFFAF